MEPVAVFLTIYNALLWVLWSVVLPIAFIVALRQWKRFNEERREKEYLERVRLAIRLAEADIETDFTPDTPMMNDKERHASCLQRLILETQMYNGQLEQLRPSPQPDNETPSQ